MFGPIIDDRLSSAGKIIAIALFARWIIMDNCMQQVSAAGRQAVSRNQWAMVTACSAEIFKHDNDSPEGHFLPELAKVVSGNIHGAAVAFETALAQRLPSAFFPVTPVSSDSVKRSLCSMFCGG